jgi:hypothetical protein
MVHLVSPFFHTAAVREMSCVLPSESTNRRRIGAGSLPFFSTTTRLDPGSLTTSAIPGVR